MPVGDRVDPGPRRRAARRPSATTPSAAQPTRDIVPRWLRAPRRAARPAGRCAGPTRSRSTARSRCSPRPTPSRSGAPSPFALAAFRQAFAGGRALDARHVLIAAAACEMHPAAVLKAPTCARCTRALRRRDRARRRARRARRARAVRRDGRVFHGDAERRSVAAARRHEGQPRAIGCSCAAAARRPSLLATPTRIDHVEVVEVAPAEVVLFWDVQGAQARRFLTRCEQTWRAWNPPSSWSSGGRSPQRPTFRDHRELVRSAFRATSWWLSRGAKVRDDHPTGAGSSRDGPRSVSVAPTKRESARVIDEFLAAARAGGVREAACWSTLPAQPPQLGEQLLGRGFETGWQPHWMGIEELPAARQPPGVDIEVEPRGTVAGARRRAATANSPGRPAPSCATKGPECSTCTPPTPSAAAASAGPRPGPHRRPAFAAGASHATVNATQPGEQLYRAMVFALGLDRPVDPCAATA